MSENSPSDPQAVTWRVRVVRRVAASVGAAVVVAGVAPALANAAGADVPNPVAVALRASGRGISSAFAPSTASTVAACDPTSSPVVTESLDPNAPAESVAPSESVEASADATSSPVESASAEPTVVETAAPSVAPTSSEDEREECDTESASPVATTEAPEVEESETEEAEDGTHGRIVSTVAKCSPRGKDPLLELEGAPSNHGGYVRPAAHGETLTLPWGTYDLSTQAGADALCASLDAARADLPETEDEKEKAHGKKDRATKDKAEKGAKGGGGKGKKARP